MAWGYLKKVVNYNLKYNPNSGKVRDSSANKHCTICIYMCINKIQAKLYYISPLPSSDLLVAAWLSRGSGLASGCFSFVVDYPNLLVHLNSSATASVPLHRKKSYTQRDSHHYINLGILIYIYNY